MCSGYQDITQLILQKLVILNDFSTQPEITAHLKILHSYCVILLLGGLPGEVTLEKIVS